MTAVVLTNLSNGVLVHGTGSSANSAAAPPSHGSVGAEQRFSAALEKASSDAGVVSPASSANSPDQSVRQSSAAAESSHDAQERARRALKLKSPVSGAKKTEGGDLVLDGLQKLRGTFDAHEKRLSNLMSKTTPDLNSLLAVQMEVVNFTVMVDVTSKLSGQSAQAFETLLKGQ